MRGRANGKSEAAQVFRQQSVQPVIVIDEKHSLVGNHVLCRFLP
jgi:hypothetical protein